ncbi:ABC transporter substrate-binding protein [Kineococcus sp. LSe6-4]|uniref:ABC transporter substrate-binding protein n=1 Tax=Kineococcus halophytocola TaxID=3234027 RepID=A0ABV4H6D4_9ACTN
MRPLLPLLTSAALALSCVSACAGQEPAPAGFTVTNCGAQVSFDRPPERIVLLHSAPVPFLHRLGVMDAVVARAGHYPDAYYDEATRAELAAIPVLTERTDSSGHLQISREVVLAQRPDLVLGVADTLDRATLAASGVPLLQEPALCEGGGGEVRLQDVAAQMEFYGRVLGRQEQAGVAARELTERFAALRREASGRTAAVLYPTIGGGVTYAYGTGSTAHPQLEAAGFTNVFSDVSDRVFEVTREELLVRNPDVLVLLHSDGDPAAVVEAVASAPGAQSLTAVRSGAVLPLLFNFTEPPTPLALEGLDRIVERFGR